MHTARRAGLGPCRAGGAKGCAVRESEGLLLEGGLLSGADDGLVPCLISQFLIIFKSIIAALYPWLAAFSSQYSS